MILAAAWATQRVPYADIVGILGRFEVQLTTPRMRGCGGRHLCSRASRGPARPSPGQRRAACVVGRGGEGRPEQAGRHSGPRRGPPGLLAGPLGDRGASHNTDHPRQGGGRLPIASTSAADHAAARGQSCSDIEVHFPVFSQGSGDGTLRASVVGPATACGRVGRWLGRSSTALVREGGGPIEHGGRSRGLVRRRR